MKQRIAILFGVAVFLVTAAACSPSADSTYRYEPFCDAECEAQRQADMEYLAKNFPTREDALRIRECATAKTGYDEFPELPADFGPPSLTQTEGTSVPLNRIQEDMPFRLVERALVAVGQRKPLRERVNGALNECVYELGLEDKHFPPRHQDKFRPSNS